MIRFLHFSILILLVFLLNFSYHPAIVDVTAMTDSTAGTILSPYINLVFVIAAAISLIPTNNISVLKSKVIATSIKLLLTIFFVSFLILALFQKNVMMHEVRVIGMSIGAIIIGWSLSSKDWMMKTVLLFFVATALIIGFLQIQSNIGGFTIELGTMVFAKNQLGVVLATAVAIMIFFFISHDGKKIYKWLYLGAAGIGLLFLLTIRARLDTIISIMMIIYVLFLVERKRSILTTAIIVMVVVGIAFLVLPNTLGQYFTKSFTMGYEEGDITSDRMRRNEFTIQFLMDHPFDGNLFEEIDADWVHNYLLYKAFLYGLIFGMPIFVEFFYLGWSAVKRSYYADVKNLRNIGYCALLIPIIASLGEPTYPFGPGTATTMNFILFGISLRNTYNMYGRDSIPKLIKGEKQA